MQIFIPVSEFPPRLQQEHYYIPACALPDTCHDVSQRARDIAQPALQASSFQHGVQAGCCLKRYTPFIGLPSFQNSAPCHPLSCSFRLSSVFALPPLSSSLCLSPRGLLSQPTLHVRGIASFHAFFIQKMLSFSFIFIFPPVIFLSCYCFRLPESENRVVLFLTLPIFRFSFSPFFFFSESAAFFSIFQVCRILPRLTSFRDFFLLMPLLSCQQFLPDLPGPSFHAASFHC